jgi:hypothetical protein
MAAEDNIITWNPTNWITVTLMAAIAFAALGFVQKWWVNKQGSGS